MWWPHTRTRNLGAALLLWTHGTACRSVLDPHSNPQSAKLNNLNFHPLEVVSRYRDTQLQVDENYSYVSNLRPNICKDDITEIQDGR